MSPLHGRYTGALMGQQTCSAAREAVYGGRGRAVLGSSLWSWLTRVRIPSITRLISNPPPRGVNWKQVMLTKWLLVSV